MRFGPAVCQGCRRPVVWDGYRWADPLRWSRHDCLDQRADRPTCGAFMLNARELCARLPGHGYEHRTAYALANARKGAA